MVILLGTHFMFNEELGSRLRGEGYTVHPYSGMDDLKERIDRENYEVELVIVDLQHEASGMLDAVEYLKSIDLPVLALGEHKKTDVLQKARDLGADRVIINSQASDDIEGYVSKVLNHSN